MGVDCRDDGRWWLMPAEDGGRGCDTAGAPGPGLCSPFTPRGFLILRSSSPDPPVGPDGDLLLFCSDCLSSLPWPLECFQDGNSDLGL